MNAKKTLVVLLRLLGISLTASVFMITYGFGQQLFSKLGSSEIKNKFQKVAFVQDEILVKFKPNLSSSTRSTLINSVGGKNLADLTDNGLIRIKTRSGQSIEKAIQDYSSNPDVEYVQPNYIYHALETIPNDTYFGLMWGLKNSAQTINPESYPTNNPGTIGADMNLTAAWDLTTDCSSVTVAVIDTGIQYNHSDMVSNMWNGGASYPNHGWDFVNNDNDPMDRNGHGTHVAGTIGAVGNDANGSTGVCWKSSLMAVRVLDATGSGTTASIIQGINFAVDQGAKIINMSLGGGSSDTAFINALSNARNKNVLVVVAGGNDGLDNDATTSNATYPCNYTHENLICVAALDQAYSLASFSNWGSTSVDVGAPGTNILSAWNGDYTDVTDDFSGWTKSGGWTSSKPFDPTDDRDYLHNPSTWPSGTYANNASDDAYKTFTIASSPAVKLLFRFNMMTEAYYDYLSINYKNSNGNPFVSGNELASFSGSTASTFYWIEFDLAKCANSFSCSIGFNLTSDYADNYRGIGISDFTLSGLTLSNSKWVVIDGTSMASPHVAGLAALLKAYNPNYTWQNIVESIKRAGDNTPALSGKTTTGKAVDAYKSLLYIIKPTGLTASID